MPLRPLDPAAVAAKVAALDAKNEARTPIGTSLEQVASDLAATAGVGSRAAARSRIARGAARGYNLSMTSLSTLIDRLARVPAVQVPSTPEVESALSVSLRYLGSDAAQRSVEADPYWPKWDSPWWHFALCVELGEARRVPERVVSALLAALVAFPVKIFPFTPDDLPPGCDVHTKTLCHCQLGSAYQMLSACGAEVDGALPWAAPWFTRYQMADGGLNCDNDAYLVKGECPSSMVGTLARLEAMLLGELAGDRAAFVDRAAAFLIGRRLLLGSPTQHNAAERKREPAWRQPCFPRRRLRLTPAHAPMAGDPQSPARPARRARYHHLTPPCPGNWGTPPTSRQKHGTLGEGGGLDSYPTRGRIEHGKGCSAAHRSEPL